MLARSCLVYLLHYSKSSEKIHVMQDLAKFSLLGYAAESWFYHSALQEPGRPSLEIEFLSCWTAVLDWVSVYDPDLGEEHDLNEPRCCTLGSSIYYASATGLEPVVRELISMGVDVNSTGSRYNDALQTAASKGFDKIMRLLLDAGARFDTTGREFDNALHLASREGHEKAVQMLIDAGADVNVASERDGNTPFFKARLGDHDRVLEILKRHGAKGDCNAGALIFPCWRSHNRRRSHRLKNMRV